MTVEQALQIAEEQKSLALSQIGFYLTFEEAVQRNGPVNEALEFWSLVIRSLMKTLHD